MTIPEINTAIQAWTSHVDPSKIASLSRSGDTITVVCRTPRTADRLNVAAPKCFEGLDVRVEIFTDKPDGPRLYDRWISRAIDASLTQEFFTHLKKQFGVADRDCTVRLNLDTKAVEIDCPTQEDLDRVLKQRRKTIAQLAQAMDAPIINLKLMGEIELVFPPELVLYFAAPGRQEAINPSLTQELFACFKEQIGVADLDCTPRMEHSDRGAVISLDCKDLGVVEQAYDRCHGLVKRLAGLNVWCVRLCANKKTRHGFPVKLRIQEGF